MYEVAKAAADTAGYEHDRSTVRQHEMVRNGPGHLPGADQVIADHGLKALVAEFAGWCHELSAGIIDEDIDATERSLDRLHRAFDQVGLANVRRYDKCFATCVADCLCVALYRINAAAENGDSCITGSIPK
jgi:hypothetical protein